VIITSLAEAFVVQDAFDIRRLNFPAKVDLSISLGLIPKEWRPPILKVNEMRNHAAHEIEFEFGDDDKDELWKLLPAHLQDTALRVNNVAPERYRDLHLRSMMLPLIVWLDIWRQKAAAERIHMKFSQRDLVAAMEEVRIHRPELFDDAT
jgi:hypothetical protein